MHRPLRAYEKIIMNSTREQSSCHPNSPAQLHSHAGLHNTRINRKRTSSVVIFLSLLLLFSAGSPDGSAADIHVDPNLGDDSADGSVSPVKTIAAAIRQSKPGDTIHLKPDTVYRDWAAFFDKSGEPGKPITLDGHGATLDGCDLLDPRGWVEIEPGLFRHDDLMPLTDAIIDRWFFVMDGQLNRMQRCSKGPSQPLKMPQELQPGEWTFIKDPDRTRAARAGYIFGSFWIRLPPNISLPEAKIEVPVRTAGVLTRGTSSHLVIRNLTATRPYNDGFNLSDSKDILLENIRAINCGDDGISAHGHCRYSVQGFHSIGNATGICDTGTSETTYDGVLIRDCIGFDLFFLDSGIYTVRNAQVISSAAKAFYLQGREAPAEPCRVTLDNVLIRREGIASEVRVSANCLLKAKQLTLLNLDVQATGGTIELSKSFIGGEIPVNKIQGSDAPEDQPRRPNLHLWKDATWRGVGNWYDLNSARVDRVSYSQSEVNVFAQAVTAEQGSRWETGTPVEAAAIGFGAKIAP